MTDSTIVEAICEAVFQQAAADTIAGELDGGTFGELVEDILAAYEKRRPRQLLSGRTSKS